MQIRRWFSALAVLVAAPLAGACTIVGHEKVEGWPTLEIVEHHVPNHVMRDACVKYMPPTFSPMACAEFDLGRRKCHIWLSADFPSESLLEHERLHCNGYDHVGGTTLKSLMARHGLPERQPDNRAVAAVRP